MSAKGFVFWRPPLAADRLPHARRWVLSERALSHVAAYKYVAGPSTPLDKALNHWWNFSVQLLPLWVAPNLVTLMGLLFMVAAAVTVVLHSPNLTDALAPEVLYGSAICLFIYQTLDAIDGKQARRTGSSSPLGQLFDHGCDALNAVLTCTVLAAAWRLGDSPWLTLNLLFQVFVAFFMGQWEEYHTGMMRTNNGYVGVTEGQVLQMIIEVVTASWGHDLWDREVPFLGTWVSQLLPGALGGGGGTMVVTVKVAFMAWATIVTLWISCGTMMMVFRFKTSAMDPEEVGDKTLGFASALWQLLPVVLSLILGIMWTVGHGHEAFRDHAVAVMAALGLTMAYLSTRMTVCHMAKQPFGQGELFLPILLQLACVINTHWLVVGGKESVMLGGLLHLSPVDDRVALWCYLAAMTVVYLHYTLGVIHDICVYLDIYCLRIHPRQQNNHNKAA